MAPSIAYTDRYNTVKSPKHVYERLFVTLVSASRPFPEWNHAAVTRLIGRRGAAIPRELEPPKHAISMLEYAKHDSIRLLNWLYDAPDVPCPGRWGKD